MTCLSPSLRACEAIQMQEVMFIFERFVLVVTARIYLNSFFVVFVVNSSFFNHEKREKHEKDMFKVITNFLTTNH